MFKIPSSVPFFSVSEKKLLNDVIKSGWISSKGDYVKKFEDNFSKYLNLKYSTSTNSGTTAIELALKALNLKKDDIVLVQNLTFAASINAILNSGLRPKIIDTDFDNINTSLEIIKKNITKKVKAIVVVHLMGYPTEIDKISNFCKKNKIYLIEDVAESMGAKYASKMLGTFGDIGCFSFFANKIITTGEGGMCVTSNSKLFHKMKIIKSQGMSEKYNYWHEMIGSNYRLTNMQAAIGVAQLKKVNKIIQLRKKAYMNYNFYLNKYGLKSLMVDFSSKKSINVHWQMLIQVDNRVRDKLIDYLLKKNIEAKVFFYPLSDMQIYKKYSLNKCINSQKISYKLVNLPLYPQMKKKQINYIIMTIKEFLFK